MADHNTAVPLRNQSSSTASTSSAEATGASNGGGSYISLGYGPSLQYNTSVKDIPRLEQLHRELTVDNLRLWECVNLLRCNPRLPAKKVLNDIFSLSDQEFFRHNSAYADFEQTGNGALGNLTESGGCHGQKYLQHVLMHNARMVLENARLLSVLYVLNTAAWRTVDEVVCSTFALSDRAFAEKHPELGTYERVLADLARLKDQTRASRQRSFTGPFGLFRSQLFNSARRHSSPSSQGPSTSNKNENSLFSGSCKAEGASCRGTACLPRLDQGECLSWEGSRRSSRMPLEDVHVRGTGVDSSDSALHSGLKTRRKGKRKPTVLGMPESSARRAVFRTGRVNGPPGSQWRNLVRDTSWRSPDRLWNTNRSADPSRMHPEVGQQGMYRRHGVDPMSQGSADARDRLTREKLIDQLSIATPHFRPRTLPRTSHTESCSSNNSDVYGTSRYEVSRHDNVQFDEEDEEGGVPYHRYRDRMHSLWRCGYDGEDGGGAKAPPPSPQSFPEGQRNRNRSSSSDAHSQRSDGGSDKGHFMGGMRGAGSTMSARLSSAPRRGSSSTRRWQSSLGTGARHRHSASDSCLVSKLPPLGPLLRSKHRPRSGGAGEAKSVSFKQGADEILSHRKAPVQWPPSKSSLRKAAPSADTATSEKRMSGKDQTLKPICYTPKLKKAENSPLNSKPRTEIDETIASKYYTPRVEMDEKPKPMYYKPRSEKDEGQCTDDEDDEDDTHGESRAGPADAAELAPPAYIINRHYGPYGEELYRLQRSRGGLMELRDALTKYSSFPNDQAKETGAFLHDHAKHTQFFVTGESNGIGPSTHDPPTHTSHELVPLPSYDELRETEHETTPSRPYDPSMTGKVIGDIYYDDYKVHRSGVPAAQTDRRGSTETPRPLDQIYFPRPAFDMRVCPAGLNPRSTSPPRWRPANPERTTRPITPLAHNTNRHSSSKSTLYLESRHSKSFSGPGVPPTHARHKDSGHRQQKETGAGGKASKQVTDRRDQSAAQESLSSQLRSMGLCTDSPPPIRRQRHAPTSSDTAHSAAERLSTGSALPRLTFSPLSPWEHPDDMDPDDVGLHSSTAREENMSHFEEQARFHCRSGTWPEYKGDEVYENLGSLRKEIELSRAVRKRRKNDVPGLDLGQDQEIEEGFFHLEELLSGQRSPYRYTDRREELPVPDSNSQSLGTSRNTNYKIRPEETVSLADKRSAPPQFEARGQGLSPRLPTAGSVSPVQAGPAPPNSPIYIPTISSEARDMSSNNASPSNQSSLRDRFLPPKLQLKSYGSPSRTQFDTELLRSDSPRSRTKPSSRENCGTSRARSRSSDSARVKSSSWDRRDAGHPDFSQDLMSEDLYLAVAGSRSEDHRSYEDLDLAFARSRIRDNLESLRSSSKERRPSDTRSSSTEGGLSGVIRSPSNESYSAYRTRSRSPGDNLSALRSSSGEWHDTKRAALDDHTSLMSSSTDDRYTSSEARFTYPSPDSPKRSRQTVRGNVASRARSNSMDDRRYLSSTSIDKGSTRVFSGEFSTRERRAGQTEERRSSSRSGSRDRGSSEDSFDRDSLELEKETKEAKNVIQKSGLDANFSSNCNKMSPSRHQAPPALLGEVAFQLERKILSRVFRDDDKGRSKSRSRSRSRSKSPGNKDNKQSAQNTRHRFYGQEREKEENAKGHYSPHDRYTVGNMLEKIRQESTDPNTGKRNTVKEGVLLGRYRNIVRVLSIFNYNFPKHSQLAQDIVNRYGLFYRPPDRDTIQRLGLHDFRSLKNHVMRLTEPEECREMMVLLSCLRALADQEQKPILSFD